MRRQITWLMAIAALLVCGATGRTQEFVGNPPPAPAPQACNHTGCHRGHHGFSLTRLLEWATYRPQRVPHSCECRMCQLTPTPPLYTYFIGEYGPRSPSLGYPVWDQGFAIPGPEHCGH